MLDESPHTDADMRAPLVGSGLVALFMLLMHSPPPAAGQLGEIMAILNITINNVSPNKLNTTGLNTTLLTQNLAALAASDVRFTGAVINSVIQILMSAGVTVQMCLVGTWSNAQSGACVQCPAGTWSGTVQATTPDTCQKCTPGTYGIALGGINSSVCLKCPINTYSSVSGAAGLASCTPCPANSTSAAGSTISTSCACNTGFFPTATTPMSCVNCPAGSYCVSGIQNPCPSFSTSPQGSTTKSACLCVAGYYGAPWVQYGSCSQCDPNNYCPGNMPTAQSGKISCPADSTSSYGAKSISQCTCANGYQQLAYSVSTWHYAIPTTSCVCTNSNPCGNATVRAGGCSVNTQCGTVCGSQTCIPNVYTQPQGYLQLYSTTGYATSTSQIWIIAPSLGTGTPASSVTLTFTYFYTQAAYDYVTVSPCNDASCATVTATYMFSGGANGGVSPITSGTQQLPIPYSVTSNTGYMKVYWYSDSSVTFPGWKATFSSTTACAPIVVQNTDTSTTVNNGGIVAWLGDTLSISSPNLQVQIAPSLQGAAIATGNILNWVPSATGTYVLIDALNSNRYIPVVISPPTFTTWDIYVDVVGAGVSYTLSGDVTGTGSPTIYVTIGDFLQLTRNTNADQYNLMFTVMDSTGTVFTALPDDVNGIVGQNSQRVTWNTTAWPAGVYHYATSSTLHGLVVLTSRPVGLTCQVCAVDDYCYSGNQYQCPANSVSSPTISLPMYASDCSCVPGFYTATTDLAGYASNGTIDSGGRHSCVVTQGNSLYCWGANEKGQLGIGTVTTSAPPTLVQMPNVASVSLGDDFTCVIQTNGKVRCWGGNAYGQLGQSAPASSTGTYLPSILTDTSLGDNYFAQELSCADWSCCAIVSSNNLGGMRCWGSGTTGQLASNTYGQSVGTGGSNDAYSMGNSMPYAAFGPTNTPVSLSMGGGHGCALMSNGGVMCWGDNTYGQVGAGSSSTTIFGPASALLPGPAKAVSCYSGVCCAVLTTSLAATCWGNGANGRLGTGFLSVGGPDTMGINLPLVNVGPGLLVLDISVGRSQTCALLSNNHVKCWGLVNGATIGATPVTTMSEYLPNVQLESGRVALEISGKENVICTIMSDYGVACWGNNDYAQLGAAVPNVAWSSQAVASNPTINMSNMTIVPLPGTVTAIQSGGVATTKICATCPSNSYCTGGNSGMAIAQCPASSLSVPMSTSSAACICTDGYQGGSSGACTQCGGSTYCYAGSAYACPANSVAGAGASLRTNCTCLPGYTGPNGGVCVPCNPGFWKNTSGSAACTACPAGASASGYASISIQNCTTCQAGSFAAVGSTTCTTCQPGYFSLMGATGCSSCVAGQYSGPAASTCTLCSPGTYSPNPLGTSAAVCVPCAAGKASPFAGANSSSTCGTCPFGTFSLSNASVCSQCAANTFSIAGSQSCTSCPVNSTSPPGAGMTQCVCSGGYYPVTGVVSPPYFSCSACGPGKWSVPGNQSCNTCPAGTAQPNSVGNGSTTCVACLSGSASPAGAATCGTCAVGTFALAAARAPCSTCTLGSWAAAGSSGCTSCLAGTYTVSAIGSAGECTSCPTGFYCPGGAQDLPCPTGSYANSGGYTAINQCNPCPANNYCPTAYLKASCPSGTGSQLGSTSQLSCVCNPGYQCSYTKIIEAIVTLNMSTTQFKVATVQQAFINAIAASASVPSSNVYMTSFQNIGSRRRLMSSALLGDGLQTTHVFVGVRDADELLDLDAHLALHRLQPSIDHTWIAPHLVGVQALSV